MLIGGIVAAVAVAVLATALLTRRAAHDDVHSVEGYHRSLHTLETINAHPTMAYEGSETDHRGELGHPAQAVRIAGPSTVRLTDAGRPVVPPIPPPLLADPDVPLTFDAEAPAHDVDRPSRRHASSQTSAPPSAPPELRGKAMVSINRRPRRLAAPATAVAAVLILVVVLLLTGTHSPAPRHASGSGSTQGDATQGGTGSSPSPAPGKSKTQTKTTSTTQPPAVSAPVSSSAEAATYRVGPSTFSMTVAATSGACWVDATNSTTGATLFAGTLAAGERQSFNATSAVTVIVGAPAVFVASVDGVAVVMPSGFQTPFTMSFVTSTTPAS
jgi:hypothetical protein